MGEIKFRAWDGKKMQYNVQPNLTYKEPHCMVEDQFIIYEPKGRKGFWYDVKVDDIMQFTGLKDKNGVDIYEGDIVTVNGKLPSGKTEFIVTFEDGCFCIREIDSTNFSEAVCFRQNLSNAKNANTIPVYEVIGNIHENTELLK